MKIQSLIFLFLMSVPSLGFSEDTQLYQKFMETRRDTLKTIYEKHTVVETKENNTRKLLLRKSISGEEYGRHGRIYVFTEEGHFAHPALMVVSVVEKDGNRFVHRQGISGGDQTAFEKWVNDSKSQDKIDAAEILGRSLGAGGKQKADVQVSQASEELVKRIKQQTYDYFSAKDRGELEKAYSFFEQPAITPFNSWGPELTSFNKLSGTVIAREIKKISWYNNPPGAPEGLYGAVDFESKFRNINIHCGYVVWHLQSDGMFKLVREEEGHIDKETEKKIPPSQIDTIKKTQLQCRT